MNFTSELKNYLKARYSLILIKSSEEDRLTRDLQKAAKELNHQFITWSISSGLQYEGRSLDEGSLELKRALDICEALAQKEKPILFVFYDLAPLISGPNASPIYQRRLKEFALNIRTKGYRCNCVIVSYRSDVNSDLESEITVLDYPLPNRDDVRKQIQDFMELYKNEQEIRVDTSKKTLDALTTAALGLTSSEIENCLSRALVEDKALDIDDVKSIVNEKKQIIRKNGILEYIDNKLSLKDVGGLNVLKKWLEVRGHSFSEEAKQFGLNPPKGVLLVGIPGCGKSLTAKCIASAWNMPLLKLDMGRIFGRYVGDSEANIRQALKTAEAIAPCVLWIDEIEKGLSGGGDSGVSSRVFGNLLSWMQDKTSPVFIFATANNIRNLPAELLRKGRFDEIFFVDLPNDEERKTILEIHIEKTGRSAKDFDLKELVRLSGEDNFCKEIRLAGAELEAWVKDSLLEAYSRKVSGIKDAELGMKDFENTIKRFVPMAKMRQKDFKELRVWANENAISASMASKKPNDEKESFGGRRIDF